LLIYKNKYAKMRFNKIPTEGYRNFTRSLPPREIDRIYNEYVYKAISSFKKQARRAGMSADEFAREVMLHPERHIYRTFLRAKLYVKSKKT